MGKVKLPTEVLMEIFLKVPLPLGGSSETMGDKGQDAGALNLVSLCFLEVTVLIYKMIGCLGFL